MIFDLTTHRVALRVFAASNAMQFANELLAQEFGATLAAADFARFDR